MIVCQTSVGSKAGGLSEPFISPQCTCLYSQTRTDKMVPTATQKGILGLTDTGQGMEGHLDLVAKTWFKGTGLSLGSQDPSLS